jgi:hypothetical protein
MILRKDFMIFGEELMAKAETTIEGRDLRLEVTLARFGASRDRHGDIACLDFPALHKHLVVDVTVTSARTNSNVRAVGALLIRFRPFGSLSMWAQQAKLDADLCNSFFLGTPYIYYVCNY